MNFKDRVWFAVFCLVPAVLLMGLKEYFDVSVGTEVMIGSLLFASGAAIGYSVWRIVRDRATNHKIVAAVVLSLALIFTVVSVSSAMSNRLHTCDVCGYKAVKASEENCSLCGSDVWEKQDNASLQKDKIEWLKEEQLFMFMLDSANQAVDFYMTENEDGYEKDMEWKPVITENDLKNDLTEKSQLRK